MTGRQFITTEIKYNVFRDNTLKATLELNDVVKELIDAVDQKFNHKVIDFDIFKIQ